jgi:hypothetical protein
VPTVVGLVKYGVKDLQLHVLAFKEVHKIVAGFKDISRRQRTSAWRCIDFRSCGLEGILRSANDEQTVTTPGEKAQWINRINFKLRVDNC